MNKIIKIEIHIDIEPSELESYIDDLRVSFDNFFEWQESIRVIDKQSYKIESMVKSVI